MALDRSLLHLSWWQTIQSSELSFPCCGLPLTSLTCHRKQDIVGRCRDSRQPMQPKGLCSRIWHIAHIGCTHHSKPQSSSLESLHRYTDTFTSRWSLPFNALPPFDSIMSNLLHHIPSPSPEDSAQGAQFGHHQHTPASTMLKIHSLLNPASDYRYHGQYTNTPPPTPAYPMHGYSHAGTPRAETPNAPSPSKRQKLIKDAAVFLRGAIKGNINYPPFECTEDSLCLDPKQRQELAHHHECFQIFPCGRRDEGLISDYVRHIPYSSEKKSFLNKTGRDAFDGKQATMANDMMDTDHPRSIPIHVQRSR